MVSQNFTNAQSISISQSFQDISFPVERRNLITEDPNKSTEYQLVHRTDTNQSFGVIPVTYPDLKYRDIMKWMVENFEQAGLNYKLRDSVIQNKGDVYQEYLFDEDIDTPDDSEMSPLVIARMSYVHSPLEIFFGSYRFVCSNGVLVGHTIQKIHVSSKIQDLLQSSIKDDIKQSLNKFAKVSKLYSKLNDDSFNPFLTQYILDHYVTAGFKKAVLIELVNTGNVEILKNKLNQDDFSKGDLDSIYTVLNEISAWEFYNIVTNIATRKSRSVGARFRNYQNISRVFDI